MRFECLLCAFRRKVQTGKPPPSCPTGGVRQGDAGLGGASLMDDGKALMILDRRNGRIA